MPPVTAERSPPASRMTGRGFARDRRFVDRSHAFHNLAVARDDFAGLDQHHVVELEVLGVDDEQDAVQLVGVGVAPRRGVGARLAQRVRLSLAASLGDRLGEIGEQNGEPQPGRDLAGEPSLPVMGEKVAHEQQGDDRRDDLGHEDHRVLGERPRIELAHGVERRGADDPAVEQALRLRLVRGHGNRLSDQNVLPASIRKCSTIGPSDRAGKYCRR